MCYEIFLRNVHRQEFIEYLLSNSNNNDFSDDSETETLSNWKIIFIIKLLCSLKAFFIDAAKVWPSLARTNLFSTSQQKLHHYNESDSSDCDEHILEITELHKSISSASLESFTLIDLQSSSKANLLLNAPSNSAVSLHNIHDNVNEMPTRDVHEVDSCKNRVNDDMDTLGIGYTRREMKRRLSNLVKLSFKNFRGDPEVGLKSLKFLGFNFKGFFNGLTQGVNICHEDEN